MSMVRKRPLNYNEYPLDSVSGAGSWLGAGFVNNGFSKKRRSDDADCGF